MLIKSHHVDIDTPTGKMRTYIHQPVITGKFPTILFYSEIFQQTGPILRAAQIVASHGYNVPQVRGLKPACMCCGERLQGHCQVVQRPALYLAMLAIHYPTAFGRLVRAFSLKWQ